MNKKMSQMGATLLEVLMVVGIITVITVSALSFFNSTNEASKIQEATKNLGTLTAGVRNMFNSQGNYNGLTNDVILTGNSVPPSMRNGNSTTDLKHGWNSAGITVAPATQVSADDSFTITYVDVPQEACVEIVSSTYRQYDSVEVEGTAITGVADIATSCVEPSSIVWTAR